MKQLLISLLVLLFISCGSTKFLPGVPDCIRQEILVNKDNPAWAVWSVDEYTFQGRSVYAFLPDGNIIKDGSTAIKDEQCKLLCNVGGFGGPSVNLCEGENFYQRAVLKKNVWRKTMRR